MEFISELLSDLGLDFATILTFITFVSAIFWVLDSFVWSKAKKKLFLESGGTIDPQIDKVKDKDELKKLSKGGKVKGNNSFYSEHWFVDTCRSLFPVIFVVLILRSFLAEPFKIPSDSMLPTLENGDFILVSKFSYGIKLPVINTKIIEVGEPERGDIVVFNFPEEPSKNFHSNPYNQERYESLYVEEEDEEKNLGKYINHFNRNFIKRIVGLPGDLIQTKGNKLIINDKEVDKKFVKLFLHKADKDKNKRSRDKVFEIYNEDLFGIDHQVRFNQKGSIGKGSTANPDIFENGIRVPEGHYFVMGDNRDESLDSRFWGFVSEENLVGKAFFIWFNWGSPGRIGTLIE